MITAPQQEHIRMFLPWAEADIYIYIHTYYKVSIALNCAARANARPLAALLLVAGRVVIANNADRDSALDLASHSVLYMVFSCLRLGAT